MNIPPMMGAIVTASPLNDCAKFNRCVELSWGPKMVTYGLAAVSRIVSPQAMINKAPRKNPYSWVFALEQTKRNPVRIKAIP